MTAKYVALILTTIALAGCETVKPPEAATPSVFTPPVNNRVVRGPIVPDDEPAAVVHSTTAVAPAAKPTSVPAPVTEGATALTGATEAVPNTPTERAPAAPAIGETSSSVAVSDLPAPAVSTPPPAAQPSSTSWLQDIPMDDVKNLMNANVGGFPLWLMVLIGFVLAAALIFGIGGKREPSRESYAEPEAA